MARDVFGLVGATLKDQYRLDAVVGEGGFGVVYRGFHMSFEHPLAVKCLKLPHHFTEEAQRLFLERFREEGKMLSKLSDHPSIVRVFDFGLTTSSTGGKVPYLVLEWLPGRTLGQVLLERGRPFSEDEALRLLYPAIEAIALAHRLGIAHRDLKPENLILAATARGNLLKVLDFGIAKAMQDGETATQLATHTSSGFHAFSPQYAAPEQFRPKKFGPTGPWTDVHALGLLLVELVTGRPAMEGEEQADFLIGSTSEPRPTPRARGATVTDAFERLCATALQLVPTDRFADASWLLSSMGQGRPAGTREPAREVPFASGTLQASAAPRPVALSSIGTRAVGTQDVGTRWTPTSSSSARPSSADPGTPSSPLGAMPVRRSSSLGKKLRYAAFGLLALAGVHFMWDYLEQSGLVRHLLRPSAPDSSAAAPALAGAKEASGSEGAGSTAPSCAGGLYCGGVSCCKSIELPGGTYQMGRSTVSGASDVSARGRSNELPEHPATVAGFSLDKYEVTVGRFRKFVEQYTGRAPAVGAGAHPLIAGTGWQSDWDTSLPRSQAELKRNLACGSSFQTWTDSANGGERHAINCVTWYEAMAFCIWDGGRLPTEAEWEYAAAGGSENRLYPWGSEVPDGTRAEFGEGADMPYRDVGSTPQGDGRWGHSDLAGGMSEWAYDGYDGDWYGKNNPCDNCTNTATASSRVLRGGSWANGVAPLRAAGRSSGDPAEPGYGGLGFRCARSAP